MKGGVQVEMPGGMGVRCPIRVLRKSIWAGTPGAGAAVVDPAPGWALPDAGQSDNGEGLATLPPPITLVGNHVQEEEAIGGILLMLLLARLRTYRGEPDAELCEAGQDAFLVICTDGRSPAEGVSPASERHAPTQWHGNTRQRYRRAPGCLERNGGVQTLAAMRTRSPSDHLRAVGVASTIRTLETSTMKVWVADIAILLARFLFRV
mmetsp:Transcript_14754/g.33562  ORF Transcript_14754/g.33562 Transcript_14754/m.33562 type:complete len:207 (-) Transcript_14754:1030-1650(-)